MPDNWTARQVKEVLEDRIEALKGLHKSQRESDRRAIDKAEAAAQKALDEAKQEADDRLESHNGLLDQMKDLQNTFATKEQVGRLEATLNKLTGGGLLLGVIGVANLVKLFFT